MNSSLSACEAECDCLQDKPIKKVLHDVEVANIEKLDRWRLELRVKEEAEKHAKATDSLPVSLAVFNNYFSMGIDAHIALQFHNARNANSDKFTSRTRNLLFYGLEGGKDLVVHKWRHLMDSVRWGTCTCSWFMTRDNNNNVPTAA